MSGDESYVIREAQSDDEPALVTLLEKHFFPREYFNMIYFDMNKHRIDDTERDNIALDVKVRYSIMVATCPCIVVIHSKSKKIAAICVMVVEENPKFARLMNVEDESFAAKMSAITWRSKLFAEFVTLVLGPADNPGDLFDKYPSHRRALEISNLCVIPEHSRNGLANRLVKESIKYAENQGFRLLYGLFTSPWSHRAAVNNGFAEIGNFDAWILRDRNNDVIFQSKDPPIFPLMAKEI